MARASERAAVERDYEEYDDPEGEEGYAPQAEKTRMDKLVEVAPGWGIVALVYAIILFLLTLYVLVSAKPDDDLKIIQSELLDEEEEPYDPEVPRTIEPDPREVEEVEVTEEVVVEETDEVNEDPTEVDMDSLAPSDTFSDQAAPNTGNPMGVGGGRFGGGGRGGLGGGRRGRKGGGGRSENAVDAGLRWLKRHQAQDGGWHAKDFHSMCNSDPEFPGTCANVNGGQDIGWEHSDVGVSGLSLLAFLGAGYTHEEGKYKITVKMGLKYALDVQSPDGSFGSQIDHSANYSHSCMSMAIAEAYGMTLFARLKEPAQKAVDYIARSQNDGMAWRYGVKPGENDSSVTGWMVLALKSAKLAGLHVDKKCFDGALAWYEIATDPAYGKVGYMQRGGSQSRLGDATHFATNEALTAVAMVSKLFIGVDRSNATLKHGASRIVEDPPTWEPETKIDMYYWYYASLAIFQMGKPYWDAWEKPMVETLVKNQRQGTREDADGSWDPIGPWGAAGGRVYATAINVLTLEVYYRYDFIKANK